MKRWILLVGLIAIACVAAAELGGAAYFLWQTGRLIYFNPQPEPAASAPPAPDSKPFKQRLHPYFGFAGPYDQDYGALTTNSLGFFQRERVTIPFTPAPNDVVVAVFGGSVAKRLVTAESGGVPLRDALRAMPTLRDKNVVVLNLAQGAGKQPQQLIGLAYVLAIGQRIDVVINIDGFNEFALGYQNHRAGMHPVLPAAQMMAPLSLEISDAPASVQYYELAGRIFSARNALAEHSAALRRARSGLGLVEAYVLASWDRHTFSHAIQDYQALVTGSRNWSGGRDRLGLDLAYGTPESQVFELLFDLWLRGSQQMRLLAEANGVRYLHVVQPNQYYSKHPFAPHERDIALALPATHEYRRGVEVGYPLLAQRMPTLAANGIVSALDLFDDQADEMYLDSCCHYTAKGETLFGAFIAAQAEQRLKQVVPARQAQ